MKWKTSITEMIGCRYPIILGAFAGYDNKDLTAVISKAGGVGILTASSYESEDEFRKALQYIKNKTPNPFGINFSVDINVKPGHPFYQYLEIAEEEGIKTIITAAFRAEHLGMKIKEKEMIWIHKATTMKHAISGERMGADAIILTGLEGGGLKNPQQNTFLINLVNLKKYLKKPVIASGGICDGKGMLAALILGAQAVHMCTAFLSTIESPIPEVWKKQILNANCFDPAFMQRVLHFKANKPQYTDKSMAIPHTSKMISAEELINEMIKEAEWILKNLNIQDELIDFSKMSINL
ncbi:MAG: nitronate monooxygenase [Promethearchaeota archaeon]|nr:MAG: nitronate monooxygenase [Candidatus Lokiarchaeota archaeon]